MSEDGTLKIDGLDKMIATLTTIGEDITAVGGPVLYREAERIMARSKSEFVPVDTGTLKGSGHVELPSIDGDAVHVEMGFGGPAEGYAVPVHENLTAHHEHGSAKYLERPLQEATSGMSERLGEDLWTEIGKKMAK